MAISYPALQKSAQRLIGENGAKIEVKIPTGQSYDPAQNEYITTYDICTGKAVLGRYDIRLINGTTILATDKKLTCTFNNVLEIKPGQSKVVINGDEELTVVDYEKIEPDGKTPIVYILQARK